MDNTNKFSGKAELYDRFRPAYPEEYLTYLQAVCVLNAEKEIADVGCGTGILTLQLLQRGWRVAGVEPNSDMRRIVGEKLKAYSRFSVTDGTAEHTKLPNQSVNVVVAAQAFHWFDTQGFREECRRILRPDGLVSLVWNSRDAQSSIVREDALLCAGHCPDFRGFSGSVNFQSPVFGCFFQNGLYEKREFPFLQRYSKASFIGRHLSASYAPKQGNAAFQPFVDAASMLFDRYATGGWLYVPHVTYSYTGRV